MSFTMRTSKPSGNKFYITKDCGGYSKCIKGKPLDSKANVLSNCVGYSCGRFNEIIGTMKYPTLNCNAENFIERAKSLGLKILKENYNLLGYERNFLIFDTSVNPNSASCSAVI